MMRTDNHWVDGFRYFMMATEEKEKRVKQIDFSKPIVSPTHEDVKPVRVIQEGLTLVEVEDGFGVKGLYAIDEKGNAHLWQALDKAHWGTGVKFENKPEEPKDHLVVYWNPGYEKWMIDRQGLMTVTRAAEQAYKINRPALKSVVVKVPV